MCSREPTLREFLNFSHRQAVSVASRDSMNFSEFSDFFETVFVDQPVSREFVAAAQLDSYLDGVTHTYKHTLT